MRTKTLTGREVLARMKRGDLPTLGGGYFTKAYFADGARSAPGVMHRLLQAGKVDPPVGSHCDATWTLNKDRA